MEILLLLFFCLPCFQYTKVSHVSFKHYTHCQILIEVLKEIMMGRIRNGCPTHLLSKSIGGKQKVTAVSSSKTIARVSFLKYDKIHPYTSQGFWTKILWTLGL